jgi:hypothetical protein
MTQHADSGPAAGTSFDGIWRVPGRAGVDPSHDTVGVLLTQRLMTGPLDGFEDFWGAVGAV